MKHCCPASHTHTHTLPRSRLGHRWEWGLRECGGREQQKVKAAPRINYNNEAAIVWNSQSALGANLVWPGGGAGGDGGGTGLTTQQIHGRVDHTQSFFAGIDLAFVSSIAMAP